jgi:threonine/homoserine/homoserine lactone efflux protein
MRPSSAATKSATDLLPCWVWETTALTVASASGLYLPIVFAIATGIPVIILAWVLAYTVSGLGNVYNKIKSFEIWFRRIIAVLFIVTGIYYIFRVYL